MNSKVYLIYAVLASLSFATHNYMIAFGIHRRNHYSLVFPEFLAFAVFSLAYYANLARFTGKEAFMPLESYTKQQKIGMLALFVRAIQTVFANINIPYIAKYS